jgi:hypothetical protein
LTVLTREGQRFSLCVGITTPTLGRVLNSTRDLLDDGWAVLVMRGPPGDKPRPLCSFGNCAVYAVVSGPALPKS